MGRTHPTLKLNTMFKMKSLILIVAFQAASLKAVGPPEWYEDRAGGNCAYDYTNFAAWSTGTDCNTTTPTTPQLCGSGQDQTKGSPINIEGAKAALANNQLNYFPDEAYKNVYKNLRGKWEQKGFTFQFSVTSGAPIVQYKSKFTNGCHNYELLQVHYHWGANNSEGSEHTVDFRKYPLEAHFVHGNTKYKADGSYLNNDDGLLVIGVLYEVGTDTSQTGWVTRQATLAGQWAASSSPTANHTVNHKNMWKTLKRALSKGHYNYKGSLTTPGCNEVVTWIVAKKALQVLQSDLDNFRTLKAPVTSDPITRNWRPVQQIGTRTVFSMDRSWDNTMGTLCSDNWTREKCLRRMYRGYCGTPDEPADPTVLKNCANTCQEKPCEDTLPPKQQPTFRKCEKKLEKGQCGDTGKPRVRINCAKTCQLCQEFWTKQKLV